MLKALKYNSITMYKLSDLNLDILGANGYTPLMMATFKGDANIVKKLLWKGANPDIKDINSQLYSLFEEDYIKEAKSNK